jgi:hypothetical protein
MSEPRARGATWKPAALGIALALGLVLLGWWAWSSRREAPAPPVAVRPPEAPRSAPPAAPSVASRAEVPFEYLERRKAYEAMPVAPEPRPTPPRLRKKDPGIAPRTLSRQNLGRSAGKGVAHVLFVTTYQDDEVSAPVEIDGVWRGATPLSITLPAGDHLIRIDYGRTRVNEFLTGFTGGQSVRMEVELRPESEARGNKGSGKPHHH